MVTMQQRYVPVFVFLVSVLVLALHAANSAHTRL